MKNSNYTKLFVLLFIVVTFVACVQDDEYKVPNGDATELNIPLDQIVTINSLSSLFMQEVLMQADDLGIDPNDSEAINALRENVRLTFNEDYAGKYVEGYVISSDETGNFFEEIILQDKVSNPTTGVKVLIDSNPLFGRYDFGRRVYMVLEGLTVGLDSGVLTLGHEEGGSIEPIAESQMDAFILRDVLVAEMIPMPISFEDFEIEKTNLYVQLNDVQFLRSQALGNNPLTYAGEATDDFDGERILESCATGTATIFSTSTFADFKSQELATGRGTINAILTRDFFDDYFIVTVNSLDDIMLDDTNRCDPDTFSCDGPSGGGTIFWNQNFEQFNAIEDYVNAGWTNLNVNGGSTLWVIGNFNNTNYAQISGFNSGEATIETWLVTPGINMDTTTEEELFMDIQTNFDNGNILSVVFSTNFSGDVTTATWQTLDVEIPSGPAGGFGTFETVGPVNISCLEGTIYLAFVYEGSDPSATTRYHIDNIEITGN